MIAFTVSALVIVIYFNIESFFYLYTPLVVTWLPFLFLISFISNFLTPTDDVMLVGPWWQCLDWYILYPWQNSCDLPFQSCCRSLLLIQIGPCSTETWLSRESWGYSTHQYLCPREYWLNEINNFHNESPCLLDLVNSGVGLESFTYWKI